jgi:hypothetical protein
LTDRGELKFHLILLLEKNSFISGADKEEYYYQIKIAKKYLKIMQVK